MTSVMKMIFVEPTTNKKLTWSLPDPALGIKKLNVATAMNNAISNEVVIIQDETQTIEIDDAYIYNTEKLELA